MPKAKIINGKRYDYDSAKHLASVDYNITDSLNRVTETLCRKKTGEYFIFAEGGPNTRYAFPAGNYGYKDGYEYIPVMPERAREWAEENLSAEEYEKIFEPVTENTKFFSVRLPEDLYNKLSERAVAEKKTKTDIINEILREYFK